MRLKVLSLFTVIQLFSFVVWSNLPRAEASVPAPVAPSQVHSVSEESPAPEVALVSNVNFVSLNMSESGRFLNAIKQNQITAALASLPLSHAESVKNIAIDYTPNIRRGMGGSNRIILRGVGMGTEEMVAVLVHEVGHNVDYAVLAPEDSEKRSLFMDGKTPLYESDLSVDFYRISWLSDSQRKKAATNMDFVSGYAMSDCFEDFAETYVYYVLHNKDFKRLAASSEALYAKYRFMKYSVFNGEEFDTGDGQAEENARPWDVTVLDYDLSQFLS